MEEELNKLLGDLQNKVTTKNSSNIPGAITPISYNKPAAQKFESFSSDRPSQMYNTLGSGEKVAKYESYIPGTDNNERLAQNQTTWDRVSNGLTKAGANLLTTIAGNTVGLVVGVAEGAKEGSLNAVFDNSFSNFLADVNEKLGYKLPNYVSKDEQNDNFFEGLKNANFWANDVAGGISFTLGTIVSEAIWGAATGGTGNVAKMGLEGAKWGNRLRYGKEAIGAEQAIVGLAKSKSLIGKSIENMYRTGAIEMKTAKVSAIAAKIFDTSRFLATTSGNEAGMEALHYKREARENFYNNFAKFNGREPSQEETADFEDKLSSSANAVFITNLAILAPSNMAMFGSLFNIPTPFKGASKAMNKSLFGIGVEKTVSETEGAIFKGLTTTSKQKAGQYAYAALKPLVTEALWEEGLQGVTTKTAENWISSAYDPRHLNKTMSLSDATYKAFAEQYGTKSGWKEMGIGAIIGMGSSVLIGGGNFEEIDQFKKEQKHQEDYVATGLNTFGDNSPLATDILVKRLQLSSSLNNAFERQKEAIDKGDDVGAILAQQDFLVREMQFRKVIGEDPKELISKYTTALEGLTEKDFEKVGIKDAEGYKKAIIDGYTSLIDSYEKASDFADNILGESSILGQDVATQHLKDALTHSIVNGQTSNLAMDNILQDMSKILGEDSVKALSLQTEIQRLGKNKQIQVRSLNKSVEQADMEVQTLSKELQKLELSKDELKGERLQQVQQKLIESNDRLTNLRGEREALAQEVSQESIRIGALQEIKTNEKRLNTDYISGEDLANIDKKLEKIDSSIKEYEGNNHEVYYELLDLKKQYLSAKNSFFNYQASVDAIVKGEFKPNFAKMEGMLGKVFNSKKPINNFTGEFLRSMYDNYVTSGASIGVNQKLEDFGVNKEEYDTFKEQGVVSVETLNNLAKKVKAKEILDEREKEIFDAKTQEINNILKPNPNKPDLNPQIEEPTLTDTDIIRKQIEDAFNKNYPLLTTDIDELIKEKPSKEEMEKYQEMYKNKDTSEEFKELQARMQKWFMAQSLPIGDVSIADLIEILAQMETTSSKKDTVTKIPSDSLIIDTTQGKDSRSAFRPDILQSIDGSAVVKWKDGDLFLSHIKVENLLNKLGGEAKISFVKRNKKGEVTSTKTEVVTPALLKENSNKEGVVFSVDNAILTIGKRGTIIINKETYNRVKDTINLFYFDSKSGSWSHADLYEKLQDGLIIKKESEFKTNINSEDLYRSEVGDNLELFVDMTTDWNKGLRDETLNELSDNGEISQETKTKIQNTLEITAKSPRSNSATLKASSDSVLDDNFAYLRKVYADKFITVLDEERAIATLPRTLELKANVAVKDLYLGTPNFHLDENMEPEEIEITKRGTQEIITQGYVSSEGMMLAKKDVNTEEVSNLFVTNLIRSNGDKKIPIVVLERGKYKFAFPITMNKTSESKINLLEDILTTTQTPVEAIKQINTLSISLGLETRLSPTTALNEKSLEGIRKELEEHETFISADELAKSTYNKEDLVKDATIKVDLMDITISSPKVYIDFNSLVLDDVTSNETNASNIREEISKGLKEIEKIINASIEIPDKGRFVQAFDNNTVENKNPDIMNRRNVNFIKNLFFDAQDNDIAIQGKAAEIIGKDKLLKLREQLRLLRFFKKQLETIKDKVTENKITCKK